MDLPDRVREALADRYTIEREIGRGGMAVVYLAQDIRHNRPVALKILLPEVAAAPHAPERFQREILFAARLQHPHILTVLDSGELGGAEGGAGSSGTPCPSSRGNRCATGCTAWASSRWRTRSASRARPPWRWTTPISRVWSTATSSPRTSCSPATARPWWPTSASPGRSTPTTT